MASKVDVNSLISACILAGGRSETDVSIQFDPVEVPPVWLPKIRFMHLLTSLVRYAIVESKVGSDGQVSLRCNAVDDELVLEIRDNGAGVSNEALTSIFSQDNAADGGHHSSQLHHCANLVKEMGGSIELHNEGRGMGETIRLKIPMLTGEVLYENT